MDSPGRPPRLSHSSWTSLGLTTERLHGTASMIFVHALRFNSWKVVWNHAWALYILRSILAIAFDVCWCVVAAPPGGPKEQVCARQLVLIPPKYWIFVAMCFTWNKYFQLVAFYLTDYQQDGTSLCQTACLIPPKYWIFVSLRFTHNKYLKLSALCFTDHPGGHTVQIPDGPFNPTNYSGTQINVWGAPPGGVWPAGPGMVAFGNGPPAPQYPTQYGFLTEQMIEVRVWHVQLCCQSPRPCWGLCLGS